MAIICGTSSRAPGALEVARALEPIFGPVIPIDLDRGAAPVLAAADRGADLVVLVAGRYPDGVVKQIAHVSAAPLLVVRDPLPFVRWNTARTPLHAVLGWDDTATTAAALDPVVAMRALAPIDVEVIHVYFPDEAAPRYGLHVTSMVEPISALESLLERDIVHQLGEVPGAGRVTVTPALGLGHIGEHLLERSRHADIIVVGTHHRGGLRRLSSVAERVLDKATASVLLVPLRAAAPSHHRAPDIRIALAATDGSAFANCAVPYAYRLVPDQGEVHLVRVVGSTEHADEAALVASLMALRPDLPTATVAHVVRGNDPAHAIAVAAEQVGADVVCIASHARTGLSRTLTRSVTDRLLHVCKRPVLVLHPTE